MGSCGSPDAVARRARSACVFVCREAIVFPICIPNPPCYLGGRSKQYRKLESEQLQPDTHNA